MAKELHAHELHTSTSSSGRLRPALTGSCKMHVVWKMDIWRHALNTETTSVSLLIAPRGIEMQHMELG